MLPEVTTVLYQRDSVYDELSCFNLKHSTDLQVVQARTSAYKTNILRSELYKNSSSYEDYISSLAMIVDIHKTMKCELARISELTQRTNKCTNGIRYTVDQIKAKISTVGYELYTVCLSDKFSNLGVVGVVGIKDGTVDLFSLSCRALGRRVEEKMIEFALERNANKLRFCNTTKNEGIEILFKEYRLIKESNVII
jgi:FkbH-like protein